MQKKLIFLDVDGTIYNHDSEIPESALRAINLLQADGHTLAIASGRAPLMLQKVLKDTGIKNYVALNGQIVHVDGENIYLNPLNKKELLELEQLATENNHPMVFFTEDKMVSNVDFHNDIEKSLNSIKIKHPQKEEAIVQNEPIYQALMFHDKKDEVIYDDKFASFKFYRWHEVSRDVVPSNGSKLEGIKRFCNHFNQDIKDAIAVGDGNNDFEMIEGIGYGIVMGNGVENLKAIADLVTDDVSNDGLYKAFLKIGLIGRE
ncbi:Cof-type HAD-IIB family hydrolase [Macrococcus sp. DPC7161]|uniref:Cof-type HAD-IIB family hydrolase n=1 Tax=Macrococcus sp. DPC7161 TaxID=2507060 RepID=UPI00100B2AAC|nr:Cof-type HAD-IIB family hydrolase [Macrococcus sp. DPC7161]RXK18842.1 Cof-type HAD-IIB family hydrolase [Macrococcus sp. DPC7161]